MEAQRSATSVVLRDLYLALVHAIVALAQRSASIAQHPGMIPTRLHLGVCERFQAPRRPRSKRVRTVFFARPRLAYLDKTDDTQDVQRNFIVARPFQSLAHARPIPSAGGPIRRFASCSGSAAAYGKIRLPVSRALSERAALGRNRSVSRVHHPRSSPSSRSRTPPVVIAAEEGRRRGRATG